MPCVGMNHLSFHFCTHPHVAEPSPVTFRLNVTDLLPDTDVMVSFNSEKQASKDFLLCFRPVDFLLF